MHKFTMVCSCGDPMTVEAETREEAVAKLQGMMTEEAIAAHMTDKHPGEQQIPSVADVHAQIAQRLEMVS